MFRFTRSLLLYFYYFRASAEGKKEGKMLNHNRRAKESAQISSRLMNGVVLKLMLNPVIFCACFNTIVGVANLSRSIEGRLKNPP